ncbi:MAG TPA: protein kinase [Woeseiaceae bacterium]|nr:protein kinase [Woeseiaceae bacterium]
MLELTKGTQLADRYTLVQRLGGSGRTETWLAKDRLTAASVALKIAEPGPEAAERLRAEWQASIRMMHPHIVRVFEFHAEPDAAFYAQQFIDGPELGAIAGESIDEVLGIAGLLAGALAHVHSKGIVHRDVKASNVLLDGNGAPYLTDFGVSAVAGKRASGGSPIVQSPQSLDGESAAPSDDIFALGGLIFELLSGRPPWSTDNIEADIRRADMPALHAADGTAAPQAVSDLVRDMLSREPERRPDANEVVARLTEAGFPPRVSRLRGSVRPMNDTEPVTPVSSIRHKPRTAGQTTLDTAPQDHGQTRMLLGVAFVALLVILIAVVFVLPERVSQTRSAPVAIDESTVDVSASAPIESSDEERDRPKVYVDPEVRKRVKGDTGTPTRVLEDDDAITFSENTADYSGLDEEGRARFGAESTLGELLSAFEVLKMRGVERWAPREYRAARELYAAADAAYLKKDFAYADELYLASLTVLDPLFERIEPTFNKAYNDAVAAFDAGDRLEALRLFELAVAITPTHGDAKAGYERARNLETVLRLVDQGQDYEADLELEAAQQSFEQAVELDPKWQPALDGIARVQQTRRKIEFDTRMTEGFEAIAAGDYLAARAAFRVAQQLIPDSPEPADGLLQVDQGLRLQDISTLEQEARSLEQDEHWDAVVETYEEILKIDDTLAFAHEGLSHAREMSALHTQLDKLIAEPDKLSAPSMMQDATMLVVSVTTRSDVGPRLAAQRDELSRLLKRAATPLPVKLVSDNVTDVVVYRVGRLGSFMRKEISLRPGTYVVVGSRPGFRDVRLEFRVAPEIEIEPVVVQCEEQI